SSWLRRAEWHHVRAVVTRSRQKLCPHFQPLLSPWPKRHWPMSQNEADQTARTNRHGRWCGRLCTSARDAGACLGKTDTKTASIIRIGIRGEWHETLDLV